MSNLFSSSIGKKLLMSLSGLFLMVFLLVHLVVNMLMVFDSTGELFNLGAHFMATNPMIKIMEPVLAIGFLVHIAYGFKVEVENKKARGSQKYNKVDQSNSSTFASRNMIVLGLLIFVFLIIHIANFYVKMKIVPDIGEVTIDGVLMHDAYTLVHATFQVWWYVAIYVVAALVLLMHLLHGFWSAFQTVGFSNQIWRKRLSNLGKLYAVVVAGGFAFIPVFMFIFR